MLFFPCWRGQLGGGNANYVGGETNPGGGTATCILLQKQKRKFFTFPDGTSNLIY